MILEEDQEKRDDDYVGVNQQAADCLHEWTDGRKQTDSGDETNVEDERLQGGELTAEDEPNLLDEFLDCN